MDNVVQLDIAVDDLIHVQEEHPDDGVFNHTQDEPEAVGLVGKVVVEQTFQARPSKLHQDVQAILCFSLLVDVML